MHLLNSSLLDTIFWLNFFFMIRLIPANVTLRNFARSYNFFVPPSRTELPLCAFKKKFIHFSYSSSRRDSTSLLLSARWHRFAFLRQMNISVPSGNSMATARPPSLWRAGDVVACTPVPLSRFIPSLFIALSFETSPSPPPSLHPEPPPSLPLRYDKTLPRLITFITRPGLLFSPSTPVYFCGEQSEERYSQSDDESMADDRRTHQRCHIASSRPALYTLDFSSLYFFLLSYLYVYYRI